MAQKVDANEIKILATVAWSVEEGGIEKSKSREHSGMFGRPAEKLGVHSRYGNPVKEECHIGRFWKDTQRVSAEDLLGKWARNSREANLIKSYGQRSGVLRAERLVAAEGTR